MARPIKLTKEWIDQMTAEFVKSLANVKLSDGKVNYTKSFTYDEKDVGKATVWFEPAAFAKMWMLVQRFSDEVAWHGVVERTNQNTFVVNDILVYPQEVTGATVTTDQERYQKWMLELDDEVFNAMHYQGHSHVNMGVTPSAVDEAFYESILSQLGGEDWYVFMIINKRMEMYVKIYDLKSNTLYEKDDISVGILSDGGDLDGFLEEAKELVVKRTYSAPAAGATGGTGYGYGYDYGNGYGAAVRNVAPLKSGKASSKKGKKKEADEEEHRNLHGRPYPGLYGGYGCVDDDDIDYDAEIFGRRHYIGE